MADFTDVEYQGAILDENTTSFRDYILGGDSDLSAKLDGLVSNHNPVLEYNQGAEYESRNFCTIYSAMGMLSDLKGVTFTNEQIIEVGNIGVREGWLDPNKGGYLYKAIDTVRNWWNKLHPEDKVISFRVNLLDTEFEEAMSLGYSCQIGFKTSKEIFADSQDNGVIDGENFPKVGGHAVRSRNGYIRVIDNYFGRKKYNQYTVPKIHQLVSNGIFYPEGYIFLNYNAMIFSDVPENAPFAEAIKWCKDNGISKGYSDGTFRPNQPITRGEMAEMLFRASKTKTAS